MASRQDRAAAWSPPPGIPNHAHPGRPLPALYQPPKCRRPWVPPHRVAWRWGRFWAGHPLAIECQSHPARPGRSPALSHVEEEQRARSPPRPGSYDLMGPWLVSRDKPSSPQSRELRASLRSPELPWGRDGHPAPHASQLSSAAALNPPGRTRKIPPRGRGHLGLVRLQPGSEWTLMKSQASEFMPEAMTCLPAKKEPKNQAGLPVHSGAGGPLRAGEPREAGPAVRQGPPCSAFMP